MNHAFALVAVFLFAGVEARAERRGTESGDAPVVRRFKRSLASFDSIRLFQGAAGFAALPESKFRTLTEGRSGKKFRQASAELDTGGGERLTRTICPEKSPKGWVCGKDRRVRIATLEKRGRSSQSRRSSEMDSGNGRNLNRSNRRRQP
jgi:hypothetical protein